MIYLLMLPAFFFFFKQKTAYEMRISDWSSDVCSSDLVAGVAGHRARPARTAAAALSQDAARRGAMDRAARNCAPAGAHRLSDRIAVRGHRLPALHLHDAGARDRPHHLLPSARAGSRVAAADRASGAGSTARSEEHTSEL